MSNAYDAIYQKLKPTSQAELAGKKTEFDTLISLIQSRNPGSIDNIRELMKLLASFSQTEFKGMSEGLITDIKKAAESYQQSAGKRKKTYKRSSTKKSKSRRNKTRK
jgi:hypothetical protein